jgi:hypothetical protein
MADPPPPTTAVQAPDRDYAYVINLIVFAVTTTMVIVCCTHHARFLAAFKPIYQGLGLAEVKGAYIWLHLVVLATILHASVAYCILSSHRRVRTVGFVTLIGF